MNEWPEIVDVEYCVHRAAMAGKQSLEQVDLSLSLGHGGHSLPLTRDLLYRHAASIYDNRDQDVDSLLYDQLKVLRQEALPSVGLFPTADLDTQKHFHPLVASKIEMSEQQSFPPFPKELLLDDELQETRRSKGPRLLLNREQNVSIERGSFVVVFRKELTEVDPWIFLVVDIKPRANGKFSIVGFWCLPRGPFPLLGRFQDPGELIPDFSKDPESQPDTTVHCVLPVTILHPGQLPPANQWFVRYGYRIKDACHSFKTFSLEDVENEIKEAPRIEVESGDWIEYLDSRYDKTADPVRVCGRVKRIRTGRGGHIDSVIVQRAILKDVLISDTHPAHLARLQVESVRPQNNDREIVLLLKSGSSSELAEMEMDIEMILGFISVFPHWQACEMALMLPKSDAEYRIIAGIFDEKKADIIRRSRVGMTPCHPASISPFSISLSDKILPDGIYLSPEMRSDLSSNHGSSPAPSNLSQLQVHDLCCGLGGLSYGLRNAGLRIKRAIDMDVKGLDCFKENFPETEALLQKVEDVSEQLDSELNEIMTAGNVNLHFSSSFSDLPQVIAAGPSCKGYSFLNPYRANSKHNANYFTVLSIIAYQMPTYALIENVPSLINAKIGDEENGYFKLILSVLLSLGYQVTFGNLIASEYGVPQSRARLFFLCTRAGLPMATLPEATHKVEANMRGRILKEKEDEDGNKVEEDDSLSRELFKSEKVQAALKPVSVEDAISDLPAQVVELGERSRYASEPWNSYQRRQRGDKRGGNLNLLYPSSVAKKEAERLEKQMLSDHTVRNDSPSTATSAQYTARGIPRLLPENAPIIKKLRKGPHQIQDFTEMGHLKVYPTCNEPINEAKRFKRVDPNYPAGTITSQIHAESPMSTPMIHPYENRIFSDAEVKRIHSFPDDFKFTQGLSPKEKHRLMGQAVSPLVAQAIGTCIIKANQEAIRLGVLTDWETGQKRLIREIFKFGAERLEIELNDVHHSLSREADRTSPDEADLLSGSAAGELEEMEIDLVNGEQHKDRAEENEIALLL